MEARAAFRQTGISKKSVWFVLALMAALILAVSGAYALRATSASSSAVTSHVLLLGQTSAGGYGSAWNFSNRRSGTQSVEGPAAAAAAPATAPEKSGTRRGGTQIAS